jgi:hypothetical protein
MLTRDNFVLPPLQEDAAAGAYVADVFATAVCVDHAAAVKARV